MAKTDNIFVRAKAYRKLHPRTSFQDAIKKVSGKKKVSGDKVSGVKKKRVGTVKRAVSAVRGIKKSVTGTGTVSGFQKAKSIGKVIDRLETARKKAIKKIDRDIIQLEINQKERERNKLMNKLKKSIT